VSFDPAALVAELRRLEAAAAPAGRYIVAFSGGVDSTVLLHALAETRPVHAVPLLAVHVDHGLDPASQDWAAQCREISAALGVEYREERVTVPAKDGLGPEGAARRERYRALARCTGPCDWLLTAHHLDDQAETLLLNLLRGSGPAGLGGMRPIRQAAPGWLARPLLSFARDELALWARERGLEWIDDPGNAASDFDRNYLRNEVMPVLARRWPAANRCIARSADLSRAGAGLLEALAEADLDALGASPARLPVEGLARLSGERAANLLRHACRLGGLPLPPAARLAAILEQAPAAREDALPEVRWPGATARRFRGHLYLSPDLIEPRFDGARLHPGEATELGPGLGRLLLEPDPGGGIAPGIAAAGLTLRARGGGESIRPAGDRHTRALKKLLNERGILPWLRDKVPLLYAGDRLAAVGDLWIAEEAWEAPGYRVRWQDGPATAA
jgi:tRNA(Ile)-lysidine synthase